MKVLVITKMVYVEVNVMLGIMEDQEQYVENVKITRGVKAMSMDVRMNVIVKNHVTKEEENVGMLDVWQDMKA